MLIYALFAVSALGLISLLPETNKKPLLETTEQYVAYVRGTTTEAEEEDVSQKDAEK